MAGIATTLTSWNAGLTKLTRPPRAVYTRLNRGSTLGAPFDRAQQRRVLEATLALLAEDAPVELAMRQERAEP
jgi:hypothetical protein